MNFSEKELEKIIAKDVFKDLIDCYKLFTDPLIISHSAEMLASFARLILNNEFMFENIGYNLCHIIPFLISNSLNLELNNNSENYIKNTDEFMDLEILYDEYITEIAKLIKMFGDLDIYEVSVLYIILLKNGILSKERSFNYHRYDEDNDYRSILGSRIASGYGVCRHESFNLLDVFNKLGYQNSYIACKADMHNSKFKNIPKLFSIFTKDTHGIGIIADSKEHLIVDPTWECVGKFSKEESTIKARKFWDVENNLLYYLNYDKLQRKDVSYFNKLESMLEKPNYLDIHPSEETKLKFRNIKQTVTENFEYLDFWNQKHEELMQEICLLDKSLSCYKDKQQVRKLDKKGE